MCVLFCRYRVGCCQDMVDVCFCFVDIERDAVRTWLMCVLFCRYRVGCCKDLG